MASDRDQLIEFGFSNAKADRALKATGNAGLQAALDWLETHGEEADEAHETAERAATCLKCNACGKRFSAIEQAELHSVRTGHDDFVEATLEEGDQESATGAMGADDLHEPVSVLTEEEKAARLEKLREKLAVKREEREKETRVAELTRRTTAKEMDEIRRELELKQMKQLAEERRLEKIQDRRRMEEIKRRIEEDRMNKKTADEKERQREQRTEVTSDAVRVETVPLTMAGGDSARIQVRLPAPHPPLKFVFDSPSTQTLGDLRKRITESVSSEMGGRELLQTFPTRIFDKKDDSKTLAELGLAPSASLLIK